MTKLIVDGTEIEVPAEYTVLQACEAAGAEIPRFCFHERLSIAGNCRMCLVEVKGGPPKPQASCAVGVRDLRPGPNGELPVVMTKSPMVKKAREGIMEFLLINHPLDCPICDQGGECDLQDQAMAYGVDTSRFAENKRAVEDKYIGVMVRTSMNRCIHCTRCVRFTSEVAGTGDMGSIGRGEDMEITTYLESAMHSELQGCVADLCPVGALLPKPYAFKARPWELTKTPGIDVMDALGSAIRIDTRGREVMRILPRVNDMVNEEWISDKTRQCVDGLKTRASTGRTSAATASSCRRPGARPSPPSPSARAASRPSASARSPATSPAWRRCSRCRRSWARSAAPTSTAARTAPSSTPRRARLLPLQCHRRRHRAGGRAAHRRLQPAPRVAGAQRAHPQALAARRVSHRRGGRAGGPDLPLQLSRRRPGDPGQPARQLHRLWSKATHPLVIVGQGALARADGAAVLARGRRARWTDGRVARAVVLHTAAARVGGLDLGFVPGAGGLDAAAMAGAGALDLLFLLGADEIAVAPGAFTVYIGTHGDRGASRADVVLPGAAYTEKSGLYVNTEGRVQISDRANFPPGEAREDWAILRALSEPLGHRLPFDSLPALRGKLYAAHPHMARLDEIAEGADRRLSRPRRPAASDATVSPRRSSTSISPTRSRGRRRSWRKPRP